MSSSGDLAAVEQTGVRLPLRAQPAATHQSVHAFSCRHPARRCQLIQNAVIAITFRSKYDLVLGSTAKIDVSPNESERIMKRCSVEAVAAAQGKDDALSL